MYQRDKAENEPILFTFAEAAEKLSISEREIRRMVARDTLPFVEIGRLRRIAYEDLRAWVKRQRKFHSYLITPDTLRLVKRQEDDDKRAEHEKRLANEFAWD